MVRLVVSSPGGLGHLGPVLRLASAARHAGHAVTCVVAEEGAELVRRNDLALRTLPADDAALRQRAADLAGEVGQLMAQGRRDEGDRLYVRTSFGRLQTEAGLRAMLDAVDELQPDVVLTDPFQSAAVGAAILADVPLALVPFAAWQPLAALFPELAAGMAPVTEPLGLDGDRVVARMRAAPRFSPLPPSLEHARDDGATVRWRLAEPGWTDDLDDHVRQALADETRPLVYATLGTVAGSIPPMRDLFLGALLPALAQLDVRCVLTVGRHTDLDAVPTAPDNVTIAPFLPQRPLLAMADLAVSHGGLNTLLDVAVAGVPHVVVPLHAGDGHWNAARIAALGVGRSLTGPSVTPAAAATAIDDVLGDIEAMAAARRLAEEVGALPAPDDVVPRLEAIGN